MTSPSPEPVPAEPTTDAIREELGASGAVATPVPPGELDLGVIPDQRQPVADVVEVSHAVEMPNLAAIVHEAEISIASDRRAEGKSRTIVFFDLANSTALKVAHGADAGARIAHHFTEVGTRIVQNHGGRVVKTIGDAVMAEFEEPVMACRAALNVRLAADEMKVEMRAGLCQGVPIRRRIQGINDLLGDVVDRAARTESLAIPGQVLLDGALFSQVRGHLLEFPEIEVDVVGRAVNPKGTGEYRVHEITLRSHWDLAGHLATPYELQVVGRPGHLEKRNLIAGARKEIIEIGIGLTSFANYFHGERPADFFDPLMDLVRSGVDLKCFGLDPTYGPGVAWEAEQGDANYRQKAEMARETIEKEARLARRNRYNGTIEYHTYKKVPEFWCLGVDVDDPRDGRMFYAGYLMDTPRNENPVTQVSVRSHPDLYAKLLRTVKAVRAASTEGKL